VPPNNFSKLLLAAVDESLSSLGDSSKQAIFFHLESSFKIKRENIPANLTEFSKALEGIFGPGASYLEEMIIKHLHEKLGIRSENIESVGFPECVDNAMKRMMIEGGYTTR
jgi:hypothetical protein